jgi:hypothetical protein
MRAFFGLACFLGVALCTLEIHLIPHSHCDPGWLESFSGYYASQVDRILNNVHNDLKQRTDRR